MTSLDDWGLWPAEGVSKEALAAGQTIALLDSGVDLAHPALDGRIAGVARFDLRGHRRERLEPDESGHGTFNAGCIARAAPGARLLVAQVIEGGATLWRVLEGLNWALHEGAGIVVLPVGFTPPAPVLAAAIHALAWRGVCVVTAAGNGGAGKLVAPADCCAALSVGAHDARGEVARFSGSGADGSAPDLLARGVEVSGPAVDGGWAHRSGTSIAAAIAGGALAVCAAQNDLTPLEAAEALCGAARALPETLAHRARFGLLTEDENTRRPVCRAIGPAQVQGIDPKVRERLASALPATSFDLALAQAAPGALRFCAPFTTAELPALGVRRIDIPAVALARLVETFPDVGLSPCNPRVP